MSESIEFERHLRRKQTAAEDIFWNEVRNRRFLKLKFKRQVPISKFVELDDVSHAGKVEYDLERSRILEDHGYRVIRFTKADVYDDIDSVMESLTRFVGQS